jgi:hypothetical protein
VAVNGIEADEVFPHRELDLVEAAGNGGVIVWRGGLNGQRGGGVRTRSRRVRRARGLLRRPLRSGLLGPRI